MFVLEEMAKWTPIVMAGVSVVGSLVILGVMIGVWLERRKQRSAVPSTDQSATD